MPSQCQKCSPFSAQVPTCRKYVHLTTHDNTGPMSTPCLDWGRDTDLLSLLSHKEWAKGGHDKPSKMYSNFCLTEANCPSLFRFIFSKLPW